MSKRRANQEGTIHFRKEDGTWRAQISLEGQRLSFTAKTRQECQTWLKRTQDQVESGMSYAGANMTLRSYLELWLTAIKENRRPKTFLQYRDIADRFILPQFGEVKLRDLQPIRIDNYLANLRKNGKGERTTQLVYGVLHTMLARAVKKGLIGRNPLDAVEKPKIMNPKRKVIMDSEQVQQFLIAADISRFKVLYYLAIITGMREGELLGLRWLDIDWRKNTLKVQQQVQRVPGQGLVFSPPKTEAGLRTLALGQTTMGKLVDYRTVQDHARILAGDRWKEMGLVFTSSIGTPLDPRNLLEDFKKVLKLAGLPVMRFHDLRHTSITMVLNELEAPIKEAQHRAGHSRPSTTIDIYGGEVSSKLDERVAKGMDELITPIQIDLTQEVKSKSKK